MPGRSPASSGRSPASSFRSPRMTSLSDHRSWLSRRKAGGSFRSDHGAASFCSHTEYYDSDASSFGRSFNRPRHLLGAAKRPSALGPSSAHLPPPQAGAAGGGGGGGGGGLSRPGDAMANDAGARLKAAHISWSHSPSVKAAARQAAEAADGCIRRVQSSPQMDDGVHAEHNGTPLPSPGTLASLDPTGSVFGARMAGSVFGASSVLRAAGCDPRIMPVSECGARTKAPRAAPAAQSAPTRRRGYGGGGGGDGGGGGGGGVHAEGPSLRNSAAAAERVAAAVDGGAREGLRAATAIGPADRDAHDVRTSGGSRQSSSDSFTQASFSPAHSHAPRGPLVGREAQAR